MNDTSIPYRTFSIFKRTSNSAVILKVGACRDAILMQLGFYNTRPLLFSVIRIALENYCKPYVLCDIAYNQALLALIWSTAHFRLLVTTWAIPPPHTA